MKDKQLSSIIEKRRTLNGDYPPEWIDISRQVKELARWCCERCGVRNNEDNEPDGTMLTVHHLDGIKSNLEWWNLAALCQRCHLRIQKRVKFYRIPHFYNWHLLRWEPYTEHSLWMAKHIKSYNVYAMLHDLPQIPLTSIKERSYASEWRR